MTKQFIDLIKSFLGGFDNLLYTMLVFLVVDYITGIVCALIAKNFSFKAALLEIYKKILVITIVGIANLLDYSVWGNIGFLRKTVISFYIASEGISLSRKAKAINVRFPKALTGFLEFIGFPAFEGKNKFALKKGRVNTKRADSEVANDSQNVR